uniref:Uncharacterized protein n=1 Tax=Saimiri boliviensis boliviensis TaxID=39432 RepID=A0A2K6TQ07_SAIBB
MPGLPTTQVYCKMVLHGAKYLHCTVSRLLVAEKQKPHKEHVPLGGPGAYRTLFVALTLIDSWCKDHNYVISGYYLANEQVKNASPNQVAEKVALRIAEGFSDTCLGITEIISILIMVPL